MPEYFIPFDIAYFSHPKIMGLYLKFGRAAEAWPIKLWCWAAQHSRSTGQIPRDMVENLIDWRGEPGKAVSELLALRLLDPVNEVFVVIHDWLGDRRAGEWIRRYEDKKAAMLKRYHETKGKKSNSNGKENRIVIQKLSANYPIADETPPSPPSGGTHTPEAELLTKALVDLWNHGKPASAWIKVTPKRTIKVRARLKDGFTPEQLKQAIANIRESEFHMGANNNGWRCPGPEWVFNSVEKCEEWVHKHEVKAAPRADSVEAIREKFLKG